ncbi:MAG: hypothetical protein K0R19_521 [Bacillota bacterium]|jgi:diguanylate cyclase (GGDEF)-like protein|nr:hypothetical protein [Bacillota bacterium]
MSESMFFYKLFQNSAIPQVVVNKDMDLILTNNQMFQSLHMEIRDVSYRSFGEAFHCKILESGRCRCGEKTDCINCDLRNMARQILHNERVSDNVIQYSFTHGNQSISKWFQLIGSQITWFNEEYAVLSFVDLTGLHRQVDELKALLTLDHATGTMNKASLMAALKDLAETEKNAGSVTVCMIDFDHFKLLNDRYGHLMGDKVLEVFSDISRSHIRKNDLLGRFGGEEFIFIFFETDQRQSLQILKRIHNELEAFFADTVEIPVTFSAGVIHVAPDDKILQCTDLLMNVDQMLYRAKKHGRGRAMCNMGEIVFRNFENEREFIEN